MNVIPLRAVQSQTLTVVLSGQNCRLNVYQKSTGLFLDLYISDSPVLTTVLCRDRVKIVRDEYRAFVGDLAFADQQGNDDPEFTGLGSRFILYYGDAGEL